MLEVTLAKYQVISIARAPPHFLLLIHGLRSPLHRSKRVNQKVTKEKQQNNKKKQTKKKMVRVI